MKKAELSNLIMEQTKAEIQSLYESGSINEEQLNELMAGLQSLASNVASGVAGAAKNVAGKVSGAVGNVATAAKTAYQAGEEKKRQELIKKNQGSFVPVLDKQLDAIKAQSAKLGDNITVQAADALKAMARRTLTNLSRGLSATGSPPAKGSSIVPPTNPGTRSSTNPPTANTNDTIPQPMTTMHESLQVVIENTVKQTLKNLS